MNDIFLLNFPQVKARQQAIQAQSTIIATASAIAAVTIVPIVQDHPAIIAVTAERAAPRVAAGVSRRVSVFFTPTSFQDEKKYALALFPRLKSEDDYGMKFDHMRHLTTCAPLRVHV